MIRTSSADVCPDLVRLQHPVDSIQQDELCREKALYSIHWLCPHIFLRLRFHIHVRFRDLGLINMQGYTWLENLSTMDSLGLSGTGLFVVACFM